MIGTFIVTFAIIALAMLGLSIGVLLGKKTPLKASCGAPLKFKAGEAYDCKSCSCHDEKDKSAPLVQIT